MELTVPRELPMAGLHHCSAWRWWKLSKATRAHSPFHHNTTAACHPAARREWWPRMKFPSSHLILTGCCKPPGRRQTDKGLGSCRCILWSTQNKLVPIPGGRPPLSWQARHRRSVPSHMDPGTPVAITRSDSTGMRLRLMLLAEFPFFIELYQFHLSSKERMIVRALQLIGDPRGSPAAASARRFPAAASL